MAKTTNTTKRGKPLKKHVHITRVEGDRYKVSYLKGKKNVGEAFPAKLDSKTVEAIDTHLSDKA